MNKDQVKGRAKIVEGKIQESVGKITGSDRQQVKGLGKQIAGNMEKAYGDAKQVLKTR